MATGPASLPELRRASAEDSAEIAEVYLESVRAAMPWLATVHSDAEVRSWVARVVVPDHEVWVTADHGAITGFAAIDLGSRMLAHLYVGTEHQGRGLGDTLLARAKQRSPQGLTLWAFQRNHRARSFYERRGFAAIEFTDGAGNEEREPDVLYEWRGEAQSVAREVR